MLFDDPDVLGLRLTPSLLRAVLNLAVLHWLTLFDQEWMELVNNQFLTRLYELLEAVQFPQARISRYQMSVQVFGRLVREPLAGQYVGLTARPILFLSEKHTVRDLVALGGIVLEQITATSLRILNLDFFQLTLR